MKKLLKELNEVYLEQGIIKRPRKTIEAFMPIIRKDVYDIERRISVIKKVITNKDKMKKLLLIFLFPFLLVSCFEKDEPEPLQTTEQKDYEIVVDKFNRLNKVWCGGVNTYDIDTIGYDKVIWYSEDIGRYWWWMGSGSGEADNYTGEYDIDKAISNDGMVFEIQDAVTNPDTIFLKGGCYITE